MRAMNIDEIFKGYNQGTIDEIKQRIADAGCVIVPREPTEAMILAGLGADCSAEMPELENGWRAMIAALAEQPTT
jgi:hypothetical protein